MNPLTKGLSIGLLVSLIACAVLFGLWRTEVLQHSITTKSLNDANATIAQSSKNLAAAEKANHGYQTDLDRLNVDIKRLRNRPAKCVTVARPPVLHADGATGSGHGEEDGGRPAAGIRSDFLLDYAIEAETFRIERNACISFVNQVWEAQQ